MKIKSFLKFLLLILLLTPVIAIAGIVETKYVTLLNSNFNNGTAEGWMLGQGWSVIQSGGNGSLYGTVHSNAQPVVADSWSDFEVTLRFKIEAGGFHFNIRHNPGSVFQRYFLGVSKNGWCYFSKQIGDTFSNNLLSWNTAELNDWHALKVTTAGNQIKIYIDNVLRGSYIDNSNPIRTGIISIEALPVDETKNVFAKIFFDDVVVQGPKLTQNNPWEKMGGPIGGLGYDIRIHPADKDIMFVTDNPSGIQKSTDGGRTWRSSNTGVDARMGASGEWIPNFSLTIDPNNPNTVWSGTQSIKGIFKSTDGGETWIRKDNGIEETNSISFRGFAIKPGDSNTVLAAAEITTNVMGEEFDKAKGKIYRTTDGGEHWQSVWAGDSLARVLIFNPVDTNIVYCSTGIFDREAWNGTGIGILKSRDGGLTWSPINNGIDNLFVGFLEMHPTNPDVLYAASGMNVLSYHGQYGGVYRTTNGGDTWLKLLGNDIFTVVVVSKSNQNIIYAGSGGAFYRSDDSGTSWKKFNNQRENCWGPPGIRAGCPISAVVDPDNPYVVFANNYGGGAFKSTDGAQTWIDSSKGYTGATLWKVRSARNKIYTIGRTGPFRSDDSGLTWNGILYSPASMAEWNDIVVHPQNNLEIIASDEHQGVILKSLDGGLSWRVVFRHPSVNASDPSNRHGFRTISYAPSDPAIVYAGSSKNRNILVLNSGGSVQKSFGMYKSADGGNTWAAINNGLEATNLNILSLAVHPQDSSTIYIGTHQDGVYKSINGGSSWQAVNNGITSMNVNSLAIDPFNPGTILAGLGEAAGIYRSEDGGQSWQPSNSGMSAECPSALLKVGEVRLGTSLNSVLLLSQDSYSVPWSKVSSVVFDPINKSRVFATDEALGVYFSEDKGSTWTLINDGLSMKTASSLAISSDGKYLYTATQGEGVFRMNIEDDTVSCVFTISPTSYAYSAKTVTGDFTVTSSSNTCTWTAASNDSWITVTSGSSGTGSGTVTYSVDANTTGSTRTGTMTVAGLTITVTQTAFNAALYFPHVDTSLPWQTEIAIINTSPDQSVTGTLRALSNEGQLIETKDVTLPARGRRQITVANEFTNHLNIGYIIFDADSTAVQGYTKFYQTGIYRAAIPAVKEVNTTDIYISHIDSSALWWTGVSLVNTTAATKQLTITFNDGQSVPYTLNANQHRTFTIGSLLNNQPLQPDILSAVISNAGGVIGLELFGSMGSATQMDGILLTDKTASTLYYPHVAGGDWWTGIVAYNPAESAATITITPYSAQGALLTTSTLSIAGKGKYVGIVAGLGQPAQTAWFRIDSTRPLSGFELFGTADGTQLAAYAGNGGTGAKSGVFAKIEKNGGWTGIAFVNTEEGAASVTLTAYNDSGTVVATQVLPVGGHAKVVNYAEAIFMQNISGATYIAYSSDRNVVGFQLNGTSDNMMLDGLPGLGGTN